MSPGSWLLQGQGLTQASEHDADGAKVGESAEGIRRQDFCSDLEIQITKRPHPRSCSLPSPFFFFKHLYLFYVYACSSLNSLNSSVALVPFMRLLC